MTSLLHIDDDGCICETCVRDKERCHMWQYVVSKQKKVHDDVPPQWQKPEATLKMNLTKCSDHLVLASYLQEGIIMEATVKEHEFQLVILDEPADGHYMVKLVGINGREVSKGEEE